MAFASNPTGFQALLGTLGMSALVSCAAYSRPVHQLPPDDPRLAAIESSCRSQYLGSKPSVANFQINECIDRRVAALFEPPDPPLTPEERRERERSFCRMQSKAVAIRSCLDRVDHPPVVEPEPVLTPAERRARDLRNCRFMGKMATVADCERRVRERSE